jgi:NAD(P)-dependent dehydrogenase (short-subunit alcohol dehydrogenase family)
MTDALVQQHGRLVGRTCLVTGGTRGIGAAVARVFASEGAAVVLIGRDDEAGQGVAAEISATGANARYLRCDVRHEREVRSVVEAAAGPSGRLDVLVNAAGSTTSAPVEVATLGDWEAVFASNVSSTFLVCKHAIPYLRASGRGSIVNLGSTYAFVGVPGSSAYAATKAAVVSLTRTLALELAGQIRVNALCPGATRTPLMDAWLAQQPDSDAALRVLTDGHPMGRVSTPEEQARAALFLASDDASFITGAALLVDGGYTAR